MISKSLFIFGIVLSATGFISAPVALLAGLVFGLCFIHPFSLGARRLSTVLLQASVVGLGFGMNLHEVLRVGQKGFVYTVIGISATLLLGITLARIFRVEWNSSLLISVGTAICGGSAIAAVGPVLQASQEEMTVSLGTVFILNSVALLLFPAIGLRLHLTQNQFGLWSALAIHDTSSVVGATAVYGTAALIVGTTVKLARALWIVPVTITVAMFKKSKSPVKWPWFILFFCVAAIANTYLPRFDGTYLRLYALGKIGLTVTLFLIGSSISLPMLKKIGIRPLVLGVVLWGIVASVTLFFIRGGIIGI